MQAVGAAVPLSALLLETDGPFLAPIPWRGKRNEPAYVELVVRQIAAIRGEDFEKVREQLLANTRRVFRLS